jgi:cytochrome b involved in lipid metabolism
MLFQKASATLLAGFITASFIHDAAASEAHRNLQASFSLPDLATRNSASSCWLGIDGMVWDVTDYADSHPVGAAPVLNRCGQEISSAYYSVSSHSSVLLEVSAGVEAKGSLQVTEVELSTHNSATSCWLGIGRFGIVFFGFESKYTIWIRLHKNRLFVATF